MINVTTSGGTKVTDSAGFRIITAVGGRGAQSTAAGPAGASGTSGWSGHSGAKGDKGDKGDSGESLTALATASGDMLRADGAGSWVKLPVIGASGNISGTAAPLLTAHRWTTLTKTGNISGWTPASFGLADGDTAGMVLHGAATVAVAGLTTWPGVSGSLDNIAVSGIRLIVNRDGTTYYAIC